MTDFRTLLNKQYLGSWDVPKGGSLIATIKDVKQESVTGENGRKSMCIVLHFAEPNIKPMICNTTNAKKLAVRFGSNYIEDWRGPVTIVTEQVRFGGSVMDGLRIKPMAPRANQTAKQVKMTDADYAPFFADPAPVNSESSMDMDMEGF